MLEVGRLREIAFRSGGGGTGYPADIDDKDLAPKGYKQLIVWSPKEQRILEDTATFWEKMSRELKMGKLPYQVMRSSLSAIPY